MKIHIPPIEDWQKLGYSKNGFFVNSDTISKYIINSDNPNEVYNSLLKVGTSGVTSCNEYLVNYPVMLNKALVNSPWMIRIFKEYFRRKLTHVTYGKPLNLEEAVSDRFKSSFMHENLFTDETPNDVELFNLCVAYGYYKFFDPNSKLIGISNHCSDAHSSYSIPHPLLGIFRISSNSPVINDLEQVQDMFITNPDGIKMRINQQLMRTALMQPDHMELELYCSVPHTDSIHTLIHFFIKSDIFIGCDLMDLFTNFIDEQTYRSSKRDASLKQAIEVIEDFLGSSLRDDELAGVVKYNDAFTIINTPTFLNRFGEVMNTEAGAFSRYLFKNKPVWR